MESIKQPEHRENTPLYQLMAFFRERPFIAWNCLTLVAFFVHWSLVLFFFVLSLIFWAKRYREIAEQNRQNMAAEAEQFIIQVKEKGGLSPINPSIFLEKGEEAFLEEQTSLRETRAVRKHSGGMGGVGFRVAKGVYIGGGRRTGTSESHQEWRTIDRGSLTITNKRLVFRGDKENRTVPVNKIISVDVMSDAVEIAVEARNKTLIFPVNNSYIWGSVIHIIRKVDDPLKIGGLGLDIQFK